MRSRSMISTIALGSALVLAGISSASAVGGGIGGGHAGGMGSGPSMGGGGMGGGGMGGGHAMGAGQAMGGHMGDGFSGRTPSGNAGRGVNPGFGGPAGGHGPASFAGGERSEHRGGYNRGFVGGGFGYGLYNGYDTGYADPDSNSYDQPDYAEGSEEGGVLTGRSAARIGDTCSTAVKACLLGHQSYIGQSCSCRVPGGRAPGRVTQ